MKIDGSIHLPVGDQKRVLISLVRGLAYGLHKVDITVTHRPNGNFEQHTHQQIFTGTQFVLYLNCIPDCISVRIDGIVENYVYRAEIVNISCKTNLRYLMDRLIAEHPRGLRYKYESTIQRVPSI